MGRGVLRRRLVRRLLGRLCRGGLRGGGRIRALGFIVSMGSILDLGYFILIVRIDRICKCLIECLIEAIRVTYQIPAGWVTGFAELVVGGENDEDFGCHFGGLVVFRMSMELN